MFGSRHETAAAAEHIPSDEAVLTHSLLIRAHIIPIMQAADALNANLPMIYCFIVIYIG